jgi:hypothetical protein
MMSPQRGDTVRVEVSRPGESYHWIGRIMAQLDAGMYSVRCLDPTLSGHVVGELVHVERGQLRRVTAYSVGALALLDFLGSAPIPCQVLEVRPTSSAGGPRLTVRVTANRPGYPRGCIVSDLWPDTCVPRPSLVVRSGQFRIRNNYVWLPPELIAATTNETHDAGSA